MVEGSWYLSVAAVKQYMDILKIGGELEERNPNFRRAVAELTNHSYEAKLADTPPTESGAVIYRNKISLNNQRVRVEFTVQPFPNEHGRLPQLVRVRLKDRFTPRGGRRSVK